MAGLNKTTRTKSYDSNKIETLMQLITEEVDKIHSWRVRSILIHRDACKEHNDAWYGTITYKLKDED